MRDSLRMPNHTPVYKQTIGSHISRRPEDCQWTVVHTWTFPTKGATHNSWYCSLYKAEINRKRKKIRCTHDNPYKNSRISVAIIPIQQSDKDNLNRKIKFSKISARFVEPDRYISEIFRQKPLSALKHLLQI